jgi:3-hydroxypropanoate dehydrogenase
MGDKIDDAAVDTLLREARTFTKWEPRPVSDETIRNLYEILKWGPTAQTADPHGSRFFARGSRRNVSVRRWPTQRREDNDRFRNSARRVRPEVLRAVADAVPSEPPDGEAICGSPEMVETTAKRNSTLQGAYLIIAARALGLDCGPMSGFDQAKVNEEFFAAGKPCFGCD